MDIHVLKSNTLNINRGLYTAWLGNALPDPTATALIAEGAALLTNIQSPDTGGGVSLATVNAMFANVEATVASGLTPTLTDAATLDANRVQLQSYFDSKRKVVIPSGDYALRANHFACATFMRDDTELELSPGSVLTGHRASDTFSRHLIGNNNAWSNAITITGVTHVEDVVLTWTNYITFNIGAVANPFTPGSYIYVRPAYTSGDTSGFFDFVEYVHAVDNTDSLNKKVTIIIPLSSDTLVPATIGNLICYQANGNIRITGMGYVEQFQQNRNNASTWGKITYQHVVMNKVRDCYFSFKMVSKYAADPVVGSSQGNVTVCLANAYNCVIEGNESAGGANGVMVFGPSSGITINRLGGRHKDDLIALFAGGAGTPHFDADGQVNSIGDIKNVVIDGQGKASLGASSATVKLNVEGGRTIDGVTIKNMNGVGDGMFLIMECRQSSTGNIGTVFIKEINYAPKPGVPFCNLQTQTSGNTGTIQVNRLIFDGIVITKGLAAGSKGLSGANGQFIQFGAIQAASNVNEIIVKNSQIGFDASVAVGGTFQMFVLNAIVVKRFKMQDSIIGATDIAQAVGGFINNCPATVMFENVGFGFPFSGVFSGGTITTAFDVAFNGCYSFNSSMNGFISGTPPTGTRISLNKCNFDSMRFNAALYFNGATANTIDIYVRDCISPVNSNKLIDSASGTNTILNIRSGGGNNFGTQTIGGAGRVWNFIGNCSDIKVDVTLIARVDGTIIYNTNAAAGTLGAAGLVVCQGTAAGSWKLMADPTKSF